MREGLAYSMVIGMSAAFLWHFGNIARFGTHLIQEQNSIILTSEIVMLCAVFIFGLVSFVELLRRA